MIAKVLILFVLTTSIGSAWDADNCEQDLVFDSVGAAPSHIPDSHSTSGDVCGHCGHLGAHLMGYVAGGHTVSPLLASGHVSDPVVFGPKPGVQFLFRPPRA